MQCVLHVVQLERLDDRLDLLHSTSPDAQLEFTLDSVLALPQFPGNAPAHAPGNHPVGGQGSRLGQLTHDRPKCLIEFVDAAC
jgi:hypothetical protein